MVTNATTSSGWSEWALDTIGPLCELRFDCIDDVRRLRLVTRPPTRVTATTPPCSSISLTVSMPAIDRSHPVWTQSTRITLPASALVLLVGPAGSGKSTFARRHFPPDAVLSSDAFRAVVSGNEADQSATEAAFRMLHAAADLRLARGLLTVVDATNVTQAAREPLLAMAERHGRPAVAICFELSLAECLAWNALRPGRMVPARVVRRQHATFLRAVPHLTAEGFHVERLHGPRDVSEARVSLAE